MLRALWLLTHVLILSGLLLWAHSLSGGITLQFGTLTLTADLGLVVAGAYVLLLLTLSLHTLWQRALSAPAALTRAHIQRQQTQHINAVTGGLSALASGNIKQAKRRVKTALKTQHHAQHSPALLTLLQAKIAEHDGNQKTARTLYKQLSHDENASFLGVRALLQEAAATHNHDKIHKTLNQLEKAEAASPWVQRYKFDLSVAEKNWDAALLALDKLKSSGAIDKATYHRHKAAILTAQTSTLPEGKERTAALKTAIKLRPDFTPAITALYKDMSQSGTALRGLKAIIKTAWQITPHPDLVPIWQKTAPVKTQTAPLKALKHLQKLTALNKNSYQSHIALAQACLNAQLWGEAQNQLNTAVKDATQNWYNTMILLAKDTGKDDDDIEEWKAKRNQAPQDATWVCTQTGRTYNNWQLISAHGVFDTLIWSRPDSYMHMQAMQSLQHDQNKILLENI